MVCKLEIVKALLLLLPWFAAAGVAAQNPISPMGVYIADPSARVDRDGRLYVYGSLDESPDHYCSHAYHVLSSSDLMHWSLHRNVFAWPDIIYAPDLIRSDSTYYLYFENPRGDEFVASAPSPTGPFTDAVRIAGPQQIDPGLFVDTDGQAYYFWGQFAAKGAKLNPDLRTLDLATQRDSIVSERDHYYHEGSFVVRRGRYYYFVFADISRRGRPTCLGYAMSTSPMGPYEYKGVIIDNAGCDPETWNNHGSIVQFGDAWFVLYHRSTHASRSMRKACIEPIRFNADGTIDEVPMTSQGAAPPLDARSRIDGARACLLHGHARIRLMPGSLRREELGAIRSGDWALWRYLDFSRGSAGRRRSAVRGIDEVALRLRAQSAARITLVADSLGGRELGHIDVEAAAGWQTVHTRVRAPRGVHALYLKFEGSSSDADLLSLDWLQFR